MINETIRTNTTLAHERGMTDASRDFRDEGRRSINELANLEAKAKGYVSGYNRAWKICTQRAEAKRGV